MSPLEKITTMKDAQQLIREFDELHNTQDVSVADTVSAIKEAVGEITETIDKDKASDILGDAFFEICRLANTLHVDLEDAFMLSHPHKTKK